MKFTDGFWRIRKGVSPYYPVQVHEVEIEKDALIVYASTRRINHRGDTIGLPLLTIRFSSPMDNVIRVQMYHHKGVPSKKPEFELNLKQGQKVKISNDSKAATLTSGKLSVRVNKTGDWKIEFKDSNKVITDSGWRGMGAFDVEGERYMHQQLALGVGECVYGLGERFTPFVKNGQIIDIWNADGGTSSEQAYKNIPFYITNRGYGVLVNQPEKVSFEVASEKVERIQFSIPGDSLEYFMIYGPSPKEVLTRYTELSGRPALPPAWSFGLWLTTSFVTNYDEKTVTGFIQGMAKRNLPLHVFHFDCFWMKELHWCDFEWDKKVFPDPKAMLKRLKSRGLHICVWINPYIAQRSKLFDEGMEKGYLLKREDGSVWQWDNWQPGMAYVDFTNPKACKWFADKLRELVDMGVDCFKTDFGEVIPTDVVYFDGSDPVKMHNYYTYLYNKTVFGVLQEKFGKGEAIVFARSATVGGQKFPIHWGGDCTATFESMAESLRGGLSLCLSGFGFWSHDIGGFEQTASADVYKRWCAFGLLSSHSRLHGNSSYRVPWLFDEEAVDVLRFFTNLKCRLMPYIFGKACQAHEEGIPVMRAMFLEFPDDPGCDTLDRQYMLGDSLLVAPVFTSNGIVDYYLPVGKWTNFFTGKIIEGGRWLHEKHNYLSLPLMARPNTIIPVGVNKERPDYDYSDGVIFHIFELKNGAELSVRVPTIKGKLAMTLEVNRKGQEIQIKTRGTSKSWKVLLRGVNSIQSIEGGKTKKDALGTLLIPEKGTNSLIVYLTR